MVQLLRCEPNGPAVCLCCQPEGGLDIPSEGHLSLVTTLMDPAVHVEIQGPSRPPEPGDAKLSRDIIENDFDKTKVGAYLEIAIEVISGSCYVAVSSPCSMLQQAQRTAIEADSETNNHPASKAD